VPLKYQTNTWTSKPYPLFTKCAEEPFLLRRSELIKHVRYYWLLLAEIHLTRHLFGSMLRRMEALPLPAG
jgi:hypothetical protein